MARVNRDPGPMTYDSRLGLLTKPVTVTVAVAYPRERVGSIDEISTSYCAYAFPLGAQ